MKKLIALVMVLGIASLAPAGLVDGDITLEMKTPGVVTVIGNIATLDYAGSGFGVYVPGAATDPVITNGVVLEAAGDLGALTQWAGYNGVDVAPNASGAEGTAPVAIGDWFSFDYTGAVGDQLEIWDYAISSAAPIGTLAIQGIPEPATMALLGLGALVLRRKK